jgi:hypothetical protein
MKKGNHLFALLFGGMFFMAGAGFFYLMVVSNLIDAWQMQSWQPTTAQLLNAQIISHQSRNDDGGSKTMYKVEASYVYQVDGRRYAGNRPSIDTGSSNEYADHSEILDKLKQEDSTNTGITVWYDPEQPSQSVFDRSLNWRTLIMMTAFCLVFMLIGGGILAYTFFSRAEDKPVKRNIDPDKPWTSRLAWASPVIYSRAQGSVKMAWFLVALSLSFCGTFVIAMFGRHPVATGFALLLGLLPVLALKRAIRLQREWTKFKWVELHLDPHPGVIGGTVGGEMVIPLRSQTGSKFEFKLRCVEHETTGSGKQRTTSRSDVWSETKNIYAKSNLEGCHLEFAFDVPAGQQASTEPGRHYFEWVLSVKGENDTVDFDREYELPVFVTADSQTEDEELHQNPLTGMERHELEQRLSVTRRSGFISLKTPGSKVGIAFAGIGGLFTIIGIAVAILSAPVFGTVFASFGSLFLLLGLWVWGRNCHVEISSASCDVKTFWFKRLIRQQQLLPQHIKSISSYRSSSTTTNGKKTRKYGLRMHPYLGSTIDIGGEFKSSKNAIHMKQEIEKVLNIKGVSEM